MVNLKTVLSLLPVLQLFEVSSPVLVSVDASPVGLEAVFIQDGQLVCVLLHTSTQRLYCHIEKELLAIEFGLLWFHQYVNGQRAIVESDHKPLVSLLDKPIKACSPRIQRMRFRLQWSSPAAKELFIKDTLSCAPSPRFYDNDVTADCQEQVHHVLTRVVPAESTRRRYADATSRDHTLQLLRSLMEAVRPEHRRSCPPSVKRFSQVRH
jgi:hypothetical protein